MASHSPQRSRRPPQTQQMNQGAMLNHPPREASPSPSLRERPRALKTQSMPMVPSAASFPVQPSAQQQQQPSPTIPNVGMRRSPTLGQVSRLLPTPPHPNPATYPDDRRMSPPPGPQQSHSQPNVNSHYTRPPLRAPTAAYPSKFQELESQMTPEFFADIDRAAEQQQAQYQSTQQPLSYQPISRSESPLPGKGPAVERARASGERSSPLNPENAQQRGRREQLVARESPKTQNRQPASPIVQAFPQGQSHSPERRMSPLQHSPLIIPGEPHPSSYLAQYNAREAAAAAAAASVRRAQNNEARLNAPAIQGQSGQTIAARTPDRSLPVQEEDEVASKNNTGTNVSNAWQMKEGIAEDAFRAPSPTPSSDLNPEGNVQRYEPHQVNAHQAIHPDEEKAVPIQDEDAHPKYPDRDSTEEEGSYTPRSPTAGLPEENHFSGQNIPVRVPVPVSHRSKGRNGATEHVMRGLETTLLEQQQQQQKAPTAPVLQGQVPSERPPQYADQRQQPPSIGNPNPNGHQYQNYSPAQEYSTNQSHGTQLSPSDERYISPQVYPDDFHSYGEDSTSAYIQSYLGSPRPDAPIPPTPHSQTAAPSPSPYYPSYVPKDMPVPSRRFHAGSPYPYPFNHVRRQRPQPSRFGTFPNGVDPNDLTEKIARQWQVYAQNNQGSVTDSTLSPRSTPFQDHMYDHWAYLHTQRMMGTAMLDTASMQSSPSHQPVPLPMPNFASRKKEKSGTPPRRTYARKPPPRVESTQPRDTSPELSSSGEETAGEDKTYSTTKEGILAPDPLPFPVVDTPTTTVDGDDEGDWVDEEDEDDLDDLIDLEYHPDFIKNVSKRRRKWEVGWENLIQAFQALDRQTDATMILLASPSHTTKLHALKSRSIRRQPFLLNSVDMSHIRSGFARIAAGRRSSRPHKSSFGDGLPGYSTVNGGGGTGDGSDGSSASGSVNTAGNVDVRRALDAVRVLSERREARLMEVMQQTHRDQERIEELLRHALADKSHLGNGSPRLAS